MRMSAADFQIKHGARAGSKSTGKPKGKPEEGLQIRSAIYLRANMPPEIPWTAIEPAGRGPRDGARQKAKGVNPGFMDYQFLLPPFGTYLGLEGKSKTGSPSESQKETGGLIDRVGGYWFPFKTLGDLEYVLRSFGVALRTRTLEKPRPHLVKLVQATDLSRFEWAGP